MGQTGDSLRPSLEHESGTSPDGIRRLPFLNPASSVKPTPSAELTRDQEEKYMQLLDIVKTWTEIPSTKDKGGPIVEDEIMWLSRDCLLRYLRATKWDVTAAGKRLQTTMTWRREYLSGWGADHISPENETGKQVQLGFDVAARPCLYLSPGRQNTDTSPRQNQHLIFMLERATDMMVPHQEKLALLIDFTSGKGKKSSTPPLSQGKELLNIIQSHYPERLGRAAVVNIPWLVWGFFKLILPFVDPITREKIIFNEDLRNHVPPEQLWTEGYKGDCKFEYDHETYWPAFNKLCEDKRAKYKQRWVAAGKKYGESEAYMMGEGPIASSAAVGTDNSTVDKETGYVQPDSHAEIIAPPIQLHGI